jgi:uncharacterized protein
VLEGLPTPVADLDSKPFWDGCREGQFLIPTCGACGAPRWPPGPICPVCQAMETRWVPAAGRGKVYSWVVVTHSVHPATADAVPYIVALVDLEEGIRVIGNIIGCDPAQVRAEMAVELFFETGTDGATLPNFGVATP